MQIILCIYVDFFFMTHVSNYPAMTTSVYTPKIHPFYRLLTRLIKRKQSPKPPRYELLRSYKHIESCPGKASAIHVCGCTVFRRQKNLCFIKNILKLLNDTL